MSIQARDVRVTVSPHAMPRTHWSLVCSGLLASDRHFPLSKQSVGRTFRGGNLCASSAGKTELIFSNRYQRTVASASHPLSLTVYVGVAAIQFQLTDRR